MSQYPSPYQPQQPSYGYYGDPYGTLRAPAKRASMLMFVLGGALCLCGVCCMGVGPMLNTARLDPQTASQFNELQSQLPISMQAMFMFIGILSAVPGLILIILGFFVRNGGLGAVITSIVFTGICLLGLLFFIVSGMIDAAAGGGANTLAGLAIFFVILAPFLLLLFWLIQAARNSGQISAAQAQYQMQYWQYQQQQQAYQQPPSQQQPPQGWPPPPPSSPPPTDRAG